MKQSAVEWLVNDLKKSKHWYRLIDEVHQNSTINRDVIEQAKAMEKQQQGYSLDDLKKAYAMGRTNKTIKDFNEVFKKQIRL